MLFCVVLPTENRDLRASYVHSSPTQGFLIGVIIQLMRAESNSKSFSFVFVIVIYYILYTSNGASFLLMLLIGHFMFANNVTGVLLVHQHCSWSVTCWLLMLLGFQ